MKIVKAFPPNYREIVRAFPIARRVGVIFAYGDTIYAPNAGTITEHLKRHEAVHSARQQTMGVDNWWREYISNREFRYQEELLAHKEEYRSMLAGDIPQRIAIKTVVDRLASPLYSCGRSKAQVEMDILKQ